MFLYRIARKANGYTQYITADGAAAAVQALVHLEPEDSYLCVWNGNKQRWTEIPEDLLSEIYAGCGGDPGNYTVISSEWDQEGD